MTEFRAPPPESGVHEEFFEDVRREIGSSSQGVGFTIIPPTGNWFRPGVTGSDSLGTTFTVTANRLYTVPFSPVVNISVTDLGFHVGTSLSGNGRVGIYTNEGQMVPNVLLVETSNLSTGTTGAKTASVSNTNLTAGHVYWAAVVFDAAAGIAAESNQELLHSLGLSSLANTATNTHLIADIGSWTSMPGTAPSMSTASGSFPQISIKV